jgi:hypothetical protein
LLTAVPDVSGEIFRGWCPAVVPLLHAGRDTTEADTHRRFLRGCIFGPGCKSRRLHYLTSLGGAPFRSPPRCALGAAFGGYPPALACGRRRFLTYARWGPFSFPTSLRLARRSASREGGRSGPPSAATLQPSLTLDSTRVSFGWQATRRLSAVALAQADLPPTFARALDQSFGWQAGPRLRPQALPHFARWGPLSFPTSLRLARRSASREGGRSGPPSAATLQPSLTLDSTSVSYGWQATRRLSAVALA